ncbi:MAG: phytanoyl-CoA dioxygenase family protein [Burkholderiales bacterium]
MSALHSLERIGYVVAPAVLDPIETASIAEALQAVPIANAGTRNLLDLGWCRALVERIRSVLEIPGVAVQCTLFDKTPERNWLVAFHQDLSIPVRERVEHPELRVWSVKEGQQFVQPPVALLEQLTAVRIHIDDCGPANGPLRLVPASHRNGRLNEFEAKRLRNVAGEVPLSIGQGGALILKPLLLHASSKATSPRHRRVLHFLFGPASIGYGLRWQHAV